MTDKLSTSFMMAKEKIFRLLLFLPLFSFRCKEPCECAPAINSSVTFRVQNQQGQNLVFGPQQIFRMDSIKFLQTLNSFSVHTASLTRPYTDSFSLVANFYTAAAKTYIYYNRQTPTDSVEIEWEQRPSTCCDNPVTLSEIKSIKLNNTTPQLQNGVLIITK